MTDQSKAPASRSSWRRLGNNIIANGYSQVATLAVQFLSVPFFLHYWGKNLYAEWLVLAGIPTLLGILDFGVTNATASKATMLAARDDIQGIRRSLQTGMVFCAFVCIAIITFTLTAGLWISWTEVLKLPTLSQTQAQTVLLLLTSHLGVTIMGGGLGAWFTAMNRNAAGTFILANRRMLDVAITVLALIFGFDAVRLAAALLIGQIIFLASTALYATKISPWPMLGINSASLEEFFQIAKPSLAHAGMTTGQALILQAGLQYLNQVAPAAIVVAYSMGRTLMRSILQIGVVIERASRPELSRLKGVGNDATAIEIQKRIITATLALSSITFLMLVIASPEIMRTWSSNLISIPRWELAALGIHALLHVAWMVPSSTLMATNRHGGVALIYCIGCLASIGFLSLQENPNNFMLIAAIALCIPEAPALIWTSYQHLKKQRFKQ